MYLLRSKPEPDLKIIEKLKIFFVGHWRGALLVFAPIAFCFLLMPEENAGVAPKYCYCGYTLILMGIFWMTECLPLAITALLPLLVFPISGVMSSADTAHCYMNDTILMFIGSLMLAYSVEQSGLHKRLAYNTIKIIGYSHKKLLLGICMVTTFVSMWITNTAATTMMVPIIFAILRVFDSQGIIKMYETIDGEKYATDITVCYFCCATYSATIGGIGTLIGTGTNLVFKGLYETQYPTKVEVITFPKFSAFAVPYMLVLETCMYLCLTFQYLGLLRPNSKVAQKTKITPAAITATKKKIEEEIKKMGRITCHELMVILLFGGAIVGFFCRSPQIFSGWADLILTFFEITEKGYIKDSALINLVLFFMFLLPASIVFIKNCLAKFHEQLPKGPIRSVLDWSELNDKMPYSFMFLLGGGFAISTAADKTELNKKISNTMSFMTSLPHEVIILLIVIIVIFVTNFASNVAVAYVFVPIFMVIADNAKMDPLWACIAAGYSASHCFMLPVGTPGNLIVQGAANIRTKSMIKCGAAPTFFCIIITWVFITFYSPVIWSVK
ncbi:protein I'm not dead yet-like [Plodia interpunctella]|uniref:protein I'm not dead yet-like n=1 Tax=Plodia interpunctella TaxID=58824 RepID=UPI0023686F1F|nr:protein I'm not dead yet-like [Plodia interpunctella]